MNVRNALEQLDRIHEQLTKSEVYRGFRVPTVVLIGVLAFVAAGVQQFVPDAGTANGFAIFWVTIAGICGLLGTASAVHLYAVREDDFARRRTRRVLAQFSPCILTGAIVTIAVSRAPEYAAFLPGMWGMIFGLGIIAARPHLSPGIGFVGFWYIIAGAAFLLRAVPKEDPSGWAVGFEFGVGHLLAALVLWRDVEEESDDGS
jgi:predicted ABC-type sugar transport system permease subunit